MLRTHISLALLSTATFGLMARSTWPVDSLLTTWPIDQRIQDARPKAKAGQMPETDDIYPGLKRVAPAFPVFADSLVDRYVQEFGGARREHFRAMLGVAAKHWPFIENELDRAGMPPELKYMPLALSAMNTQCASNTGEAGLWMLTWPVALRHGLVVTGTVDERRDPQKATVAALRHLKELYERHGDWPTAVTAFACGPANVTRMLQDAGGSSTVRDLYRRMSESHRDVLPRLMAFTYLAAEADRLGIEAWSFRNLEPSDTLRHDSALRVDAITRVIGTRPSRFRALNPTLVGPVIQPGMAFVLPRSDAERFTELAFVVLEAQASKTRVAGGRTQESTGTVERLEDGREAILYRITAEDCINCIADRFGISTEEIKTWNEMQDSALEPGNTLVLFVQPDVRLRYEADTPGIKIVGTDTVVTPSRSDSLSTKVKVQEDFTWYTVRSGESLYLIAKRHLGVSADDLMRYNGIGADIRPGQRIKIPNR
jgi:membrane-bound lytic murein transglycosylase D